MDGLPRECRVPQKFLRVGAERLTGFCKEMGRLSDAEVRLQIPALLKTLRDELAATRDSLEHYLQERKRSAG